MKSSKQTILTLLLGCITLLSFAQDDESEIRRLEQLHAKAIMENDTTELGNIWSAGFIINNPSNVVLDRQMALSEIKKRNIHYLFYESQIENISFADNVAIVMGLETIQPVGKIDHAGKTFKRRFTNVWLKADGVWQLTAKQSTTISIH